jgi:methionine sulfoxide reductase heme-binding subunit
MLKLLKVLFVFAIIITSLALPHFSRAASVSYTSAAQDSDYDGLTDQGETQIYKTNPQNPDTDGDGYLDGAEVLAGTDPLIPVNAILVTATNTQAEPTVSRWPWYITRASGLVAYILLFLLVITGIGIKTSGIFKFVAPTFAWLNHRYLGIALTASVIAHLAFLLVDKFAKFTIIEVFVPFISTYKPVFLSLGIFGFYLLLLVIISSIFTISKFPKAWRLLHYLPYPMFIILFIHGYFIGTDTKIFAPVYLITALIVIILSFYRLYFFYKQK